MIFTIIFIVAFILIVFVTVKALFFSKNKSTKSVKGGGADFGQENDNTTKF